MPLWISLLMAKGPGSTSELALEAAFLGGCVRLKANRLEAPVQGVQLRQAPGQATMSCCGGEVNRSELKGRP